MNQWDDADAARTAVGDFAAGDLHDPSHRHLAVFADQIWHQARAWYHAAAEVEQPSETD